MVARSAILIGALLAFAEVGGAKKSKKKKGHDSAAFSSSHLAS